MSKIIPKVLKFSLWVLVIILFEGVCFRFAEDYANFRLQLAWGDLNSSSSQSLSLPLDHFTKKPKGDLSLQNLQSRIFIMWFADFFLPQTITVFEIKG